MAEELIELGRACGKGKIRRSGYVRSGYTRKDGTHVEATRVGPSCVPDKGAPGKTPASKRWFPKGVSVPGWSKDKTEKQRHDALNKLADKRPCGRILRDMQAISNVTRDRETQKKMREDRAWLKEKGACKI